MTGRLWYKLAVQCSYVVNWDDIPGEINASVSDIHQAFEKYGSIVVIWTIELDKYCWGRTDTWTLFTINHQRLGVIKSSEPPRKHIKRFSSSVAKEKKKTEN